MAKIVIDAGHGGADPGAINARLGLKESEMTLDVGQALSIILKRSHNVKNVRQTYNDTPVPSSKSMDLKARASIANNFNADCFISIHFNAHTNSTANGFEVYAMPRATKAISLAAKVAESVMNDFNSKLRMRYNTNGGLVKEGTFMVLRRTQMPAILIECAFISNDKEALFFKEKSTQTLFAQSVANGVDLWLSSLNI